MKESKFQTKVKKMLESKAAFVINLHGHLMQRAGLPDLEVVHKDWKGYLELKVGKNDTSTIQRVTAAKLILRGCQAYVFRCCKIDTEVYGYYYIYTLETFDGIEIAKFHNLNELLPTLLNLQRASQEHQEYKTDRDKLSVCGKEQLNEDGKAVNADGDRKVCIQQCTDEIRDKCRKRYELRNWKSNWEK